MGLAWGWPAEGLPTDALHAPVEVAALQSAGLLACTTVILGVITVATKWFGVALVPLTVVYFTIQRQASRRHIYVVYVRCPCAAPDLLVWQLLA